jgi:hypothetical protein
MRAAIITTVRHNVGDDFVRDGVVYLLRKVFRNVEVEVIHKHFPITVRRECAWLYNPYLIKGFDRLPHVGAARVSKVLDALPLWPKMDKILSADLVVQSGAPVYWRNQISQCEKNEWYGPLIRRRWRTVRDKVPLVNLGAGTCQPYDSNGSEFEGAAETLTYIRELYESCALTTVRDELSRRILRIVGFDAPLLPCPSVLARRQHNLKAEAPSYIALNYMRLGGHYDLDGAVKAAGAAAWERTFVSFARWLARNQRCVVVCHDRRELLDATALLPELEYFYSTDHRDYLRFYSRAICGVFNRVHAAFALASYGRPSIVIGNDSRARMTEVIGLPNIHIRESGLERLQQEFVDMQVKAPLHLDRLQLLLDHTESAYVRLIKAALGTIGGLNERGV